MSDDEKLVPVRWGRRNGESSQFKGELVEHGGEEYYRSLKLPELKSEIEQLVRIVEGGLGRVNMVMRGELLAALGILRGRVPHGEWEKFLKAHRLNPSTVRNWRARGRGDAIQLREMLGQSPPPPPQRTKKQAVSESAAIQLAKAGKRLAETVLNGDRRYAAQLAKNFLEAYEEGAA
ncbi:MAG TPA: hypothetical protein VFO39_21345 [Candidatus Sulfotelmatobacter sp.]|nr:hypothetical protein [Candidatus Sulfotelmatobacter sp.]